MKRSLTMKKLAAICLILAMVPGLCCFGSAFAAAEEPTVLEHWSKDSTSMKSIVDFVEKSVDETSDGYIPKEDRIVIFTSRSDEYKDITLKFLQENGIRYDAIEFNMPAGERIVFNDRKLSGIDMAYAVNMDRDKFQAPEILREM
jgi:hypothetical protein